MSFYIRVDSIVFFQMDNSNEEEQNQEEEYIPPGERLITPADVVPLSDDMTVITIKIM